MGPNHGLISGFRLDTASTEDHMKQQQSRRRQQTLIETSFMLTSHPAAALHLFSNDLIYFPF